MFSGHLLSVYTPKTNITSSSITGSGQHIVLGLENLKDLLFLQLRGAEVKTTEDEIYGDSENDGKIYELKDTDIC